MGGNALDNEPGSLWENGNVESFNGKLADALWEREVFNNMHEARVLIERWRRYFNTDQPHRALDYRPPTPDAILVAESGSAMLHRNNHCL